MIIKEKSLYRKLLDWHKKTFGIATGEGIIIFIIIFLAMVFGNHFLTT
jgi:hypothetical protein